MNYHNINIINDYQTGLMEDLPERFILWLEDRLEDTDLEDGSELVWYIYSYNEYETDTLFSDRTGQYIPSNFANLLLSEYVHDNNNKSFSVYNEDNNATATWTCISKDDLLLLSDTKNLDYDICDHYWDAWNTVTMNAELAFKDKKWSLDQDGDLCIRSEHYIYTDM